MDKDKIVIIDITLSIVLNIIALYEIVLEKNKLMNLLLICILILSIITCLYWAKSFPISKRYKFIRYLFYEVYENKFNIAPKILLFLDIQNKRNRFIVDSIFVTYRLILDKEIVNSYVTWDLKNISSVTFKDFYFYTGIDWGKIGKQKLIVSHNQTKKEVDLLPDNCIDSGNDIFLCHWDIPEDMIKKGDKIDEIELTMEQKNSFDFNKKEVIYFFPWNFAKKINKIEFKIICPKALGKLSMQLFEVGEIKGKKFPFRESLNTVSRQNCAFNEEDCIYVFQINREKINIDNLYYILLHRDNENE